jgi:PKD repeat protein
VNEHPPVAGFTGIPTTGTVPLPVQFTDSSTGVINGYAWDFGDTGTSTVKNPSYEYMKAGTYTVNLTVTGPGGTNISTQSDYITVNELPPVAGFSGTPTTGTVPLMVTFTDSSTGVINRYTWDFGDTGTSTDKNPQHQYTKAGIYTVNLIVTGPGGSDSKTQTVTVNEVPPVAGFNTDPSPATGTVPLTVTFTDTSTGTSTAWDWDFGDGSLHSTLKNPPAHVYTMTGTYTATLTVINNGGSSSETATITVNQVQPPTVTVIIPNSGLNTSTISILKLEGTGFLSGAVVKLNRTGYSDIIGTSITVVSPTQITCTFDLTGKISGPWNVAVINPDGKSGILTNGFTITAPVPPVAGFSGTPRMGPAPLTVSFHDESTGTITSYLWNFGDGSTSTERNPSHQYTAAGTFMVKLTVTGPAGSNTKTQNKYITVSKSAAVPAAVFSGFPRAGAAPLTVSFTDESTGTITSYLWNFGDGSTSIEKNPSHQYNTAGAYTVKLTVTGPGGSSAKTQTNYITVTNPLALKADFTANKTSGSKPLTVQFTDSSSGSIDAYLWNFGDGSISTGKNPIHVYSKTGKYTVQLTVSNTGGSNTMTKKNYINVN